MKKNPLTASERRGILIVAGIALLLTGSGWLVSRCQAPQAAISPQEVKVLIHGDSLLPHKEKKEKTKRKKKARKDSVSPSKKKVKKTYRRRDPLNEPL